MKYIVGTILVLLVIIAVRLLVLNWPLMLRRLMLNLVDGRVRRLLPRRSELLSVRRLRGGLTPKEEYELDKIETKINDLEALETQLTRFQHQGHQ